MELCTGARAVFGIAGNDRLVIGQAAVDDDAIRPAMTIQRPAKEALGRWQVTAFAEEKLDRIADAVDSAVEIHPFAADLDVCLVHMPLAGNAPLTTVKALQLALEQLSCLQVRLRDYRNNNSLPRDAWRIT